MRFFAVDFQLYTAIALAYVGFLCAWLYDLTLPLCQHCGRFLRTLADLFLCAATVFMLLWAFYLTGCSGVRLYMPCAFSLGVLIYHASVRKILMSFIKYIKVNRKKHADGE